MKPKLTDWFPPEVKPVHPGVYEVESYSEDPRFKWYRLWQDDFWWEGSNTITGANGASIAFTRLSIPTRRWRGLAVKP